MNARRLFTLLLHAGVSLVNGGCVARPSATAAVRHQR